MRQHNDISGWLPVRSVPMWDAQSPQGKTKVNNNDNRKTARSYFPKRSAAQRSPPLLLARRMGRSELERSAALCPRPNAVPPKLLEAVAPEDLLIRSSSPDRAAPARPPALGNCRCCSSGAVGVRGVAVPPAKFGPSLALDSRSPSRAESWRLAGGASEVPKRWRK